LIPFGVDISRAVLLDGHNGGGAIGDQSASLSASISVSRDRDVHWPMDKVEI
jgi:hypothetical protein